MESGKFASGEFKSIRVEFAAIKRINFKVVN